VKRVVRARAVAIEWPVVQSKSHAFSVFVFVCGREHVIITTCRPCLGRVLCVSRSPRREWDAASAGPVASFVQQQCVQRDECVITRCVFVCVCSRGRKPDETRERKIHLPDVLICGDHST